jgi:peptidoglycan/LPS O-acetylase OafA/YrhL
MFSDTFDSRRNALNLLRLSFALLVIFSHSLTTGGFRSANLWGHFTLGGAAVDGFFAISGFLITASAFRNGVPRYLWQRILRIIPGLWVCLIITALGGGPIAWTAEGHSLASYWSAVDGPTHYVLVNLGVMVRTYTIAGTPAGVPYPHVWNGSLWTLIWEFYCYLMVAALAVTTLLRHRCIVLGLWIFSWILAIGVTYDGRPTWGYAVDLLRFVPIFFAGSLVWLYKEKIPDNAGLAIGSFALFFAGTWLHDPDLLAPPLAYLCIWAAIHFPGKRVGSKYDISYGTYIYAFLVTQVLAIWHVYNWGYWPFTLLTVAITLVFAAASCVVVERPALRLKGWTPGRRPTHVEAVPPAALGD